MSDKQYLKDLIHDGISMMKYRTGIEDAKNLDPYEELRLLFLYSDLSADILKNDYHTVYAVNHLEDGAVFEQAGDGLADQYALICAVRGLLQEPLDQIEAALPGTKELIEQWLKENVDQQEKYDEEDINKIISHIRENSFRFM